MGKFKEYLGGTTIGFFATLGTVAYQYPETIKYLLLSVLYLIVIHRGINANFSKLTASIESLAGVIANQGQHFNERVTALEQEKKEIKETIISLEFKVDKLTLPKEG